MEDNAESVDPGEEKKEENGGDEGVEVEAALPPPEPFSWTERSDAKDAAFRSKLFPAFGPDSGGAGSGSVRTPVHGGSSSGAPAGGATPGQEVPSDPGSLDNVSVDELTKAMLNEVWEQTGVRLFVSRHNRLRFGKTPVTSLPQAGPDRGWCPCGMPSCCQP